MSKAEAGRESQSPYEARPWLGRYDYWVRPHMNYPRRPLHEILRLAAAEVPDRPATAFLGAHMTFAQLKGRSDRLAAALRGLGTGVMDPLWERLAQLKIPVTLVVGERDEKFRAIAERMATALPDPRVEVVPGAGHAVQLERPDAVAAVLG